MKRIITVTLAIMVLFIIFACVVHADENAEQLTCFACGTRIGTEAKFCSNCGTPTQKKLDCSTCGAETSQKDNFCSECGVAINSNTEETVDDFSTKLVVGLVLSLVIGICVLLFGVSAIKKDEPPETPGVL